MRKSLWGELPDTPVDTGPITILKEQASFLGEMTRNVLVGEVRTESGFVAKTLSSRDFVHTLSIRAPAVQNYRYDLLKVGHNVAPIYPAMVADLVEGTKAEVNSEEEFIGELERILRSEALRNVIGSLLTYSQ